MILTCKAFARGYFSHLQLIEVTHIFKFVSVNFEPCTQESADGYFPTKGTSMQCNEKLVRVERGILTWS